MSHRRAVLLSFVALSVCGLLLAGCSGQGAAPGLSGQRSSSEKVEQLQKDVAVLKSRIDDLTSGSADVDCSGQRYSIAQTKFGSFAVVCRQLSQYEDGYRVRLDIGNLTSVRFDGAKVQVNWGSSLVNHREIEVTDSFPPGQSATLNFVMTPATLEDTKKVTVKLEFDQIAFYQ
jgi:outer membrane murein-binding lipoprotein Lpp